MKISDRTFIEVEHQLLRILPEKAIFWENEQTLIISDVHLGKAGHFRKHGIALPKSTNDTNLLRLDQLIEAWNPKQILFLGDLFHSEKNIEWGAFKRWRNKHHSISIVLIMGNHELYPEEEYKMLGIECIRRLNYHPFVFIHDLNEITTNISKFIISGHIHPAVKMIGKGRQSLQIPCFYFEKNKAILPAFGTLTGSYTIKHSRKATIFGILEHQIIHF